MTQYEIWLTNPFGVRLRPLEQAVKFSFSRVANNVGRFSVMLPETFPRELIVKDNRLSIWRKPDGGSMGVAFNGILRDWTAAADETGSISRVIAGPDLNWLLAGRVIAYYADTSYSSATDNADDIMRLIGRYNLGSLAVTGATVNDRLANGNFSTSLFAVESDVALGSSVSKAFAWRNALDVMRELAESSRTAGIDLYFEVVPDSDALSTLRVFKNQRGLDRTGQLVFSLERGNLYKPRLSFESTNQLTRVYGLGQGEGSARTVQISTDTNLSAISPFALREGIADARNETAAANVLDKADAMLIKNRSRIKFDATLLSVPGSVYGLDWNFGDKVTAEFDGQSFSAMVRAVSISVDENGKETIDAMLEGYITQ